jgi:hypothetical protein
MTSTRLVSRQIFPHHFSDAALAGLVGQHTNISADPDASFMSLLVPTGRAVVAAVQLIYRTRETTEVLITFDYEDDQPYAPTEVEVRIVEAGTPYGSFFGTRDGAKCPCGLPFDHTETCLDR